MSQLGDRIHKLRKQKGWTQEEFASRIGVHGRHITRIEHDRMKPSANTLAKIAEVFEIGFDELLERESSAANISDPQMIRLFQQAQELDSDDRATVTKIVQALLTKKRMEYAMKLEAS